MTVIEPAPPRFVRFANLMKAAVADWLANPTASPPRPSALSRRRRWWEGWFSSFSAVVGVTSLVVSATIALSVHAERIRYPDRMPMEQAVHVMQTAPTAAESAAGTELVRRGLDEAISALEREVQLKRRPEAEAVLKWLERRVTSALAASNTGK